MIVAFAPVGVFFARCPYEPFPVRLSRNVPIVLFRFFNRLWCRLQMSVVSGERAVSISSRLDTVAHTCDNHIFGKGDARLLLPFVSIKAKRKKN